MMILDNQENPEWHGHPLHLCIPKRCPDKESIEPNTSQHSIESTSTAMARKKHVREREL
jgi:hypothetical protein